mmetsp:Transcript_9420/g.24401  ORF Transcript_9420/g.24401 Transcript_9420/m.24401 type:complete len:350 (+) Transcript_9420:85-1134(+)
MAMSVTVPPGGCKSVLPRRRPSLGRLEPLKLPEAAAKPGECSGGASASTTPPWLQSSLRSKSSGSQALTPLLQKVQSPAGSKDIGSRSASSPVSTAATLSPRSPLSPLSPQPRWAARAGEDEENTPWEEYVDVVLTKEAVRQQLQLSSDGPPGFLRASLTSAQKPGSKGYRGTVICCAGCYECVEGPSCLFNKLASTLPQTGINVFQFAYRPPGDEEEEAAEDVMTCIDWLVEKGREPLVLLAWSMGSAAAIEAAYLRRGLGVVRAICTLAGQTAGTRNLKHLEVPFLALHGEDDKVLPTSSSQTLVQRAQHGSLKLLPKTTHRMEEAMPHVVEFVHEHLPVASPARRL